MKKLIPFFFLVCIVGSHVCFASDTDSTEAVVNKKIPAVVFSAGIMSFIGDVGYSHLNEPLLHRSGYQLALQFANHSRLSPSVYFLTGAVSGNEKTVVRTLNFKTTFNAVGVQLSYNFINRTRSDQVLVPFIIAGIEFLSFTPKGDLLDANGSPYYYWSKGEIKNIDESSPNAGNAVTIYRDYDYETNLRDANLDSAGTYKTSGLAFPLGIGFRLNLSSRCAISFCSVLHITGTDYLDNITADSKGSRQGDSKNDKFVFSSASFSYDFGAARETPKRKKLREKDFKNIDFKQLAKDDADQDGVPDITDENPGTPAGVKVDAKGRPLDVDQDGIPDYRDKEPNSLKGSLVNEEGVTLTDGMIEEKFRQDSLAALPTIREYVKSTDRLKDLNPAYQKQEKGIPEKYIKVDADRNGVITPKEIGDAIDEFLAGKSTYSTDEFYQLIDFYFSQ